MDPQKVIYIIGAGSVGGHIVSNLDLYGLSNAEIKFLDDDPEKQNKMYCGVLISGTSDLLLDLESPSVIIGIAFPNIKYQLIQKLAVNPSIQYPTLVSNKSWISNQVTLGQGSIIYPGCSINYGSIIGDFVVMNMNCAVGHHVELGNFSSLAPGVNLGGHTKVGEGVDLGIGCATIQNLSIGDYSIIGGQTMVTKDVAARRVVVGVPGKVIK